MTLPSLTTLTSLPATDRPDLVAEPVRAALESWSLGEQVAVVEIDPELSDTAAMTKAYSVSLTMSFNCVVVSGRRGGDERIAACVVRADGRADVNGFVKRALDVRKASFLSMERAVAETGMEYGGITAIGLPVAWRLIIDARIIDEPVVVIGSGVRRSKLLLAGAHLAAFPGAEVAADLALM